MRFLILALTVLLVSCATPKTAPKSFYAGVYAPGSVEISDSDGFLSRATVLDAADMAIARKSAFARLMLEAKAKGYRSFTIVSEKSSAGLGHNFSVRGSLFKSVRSGKDIYRIDAIKRLLKDLPLEAPKPVYKPRPKKIAMKKVRKTVQPASVKAPAAEPSVKTADEEPLVIMAPEDITGSIRPAAGRSVPAPAAQHSPPSDLATEYESGTQNLGATSGVPTGVLFRRQ